MIRDTCLVVFLIGAMSFTAGAGDKPIAEQRVDVFTRGDGANSTYGYRIPALTVTKKGTVLALAERRTGLHDHAKNDIVLRRSTDGGRTWGDLIVVSEEGDDSLNDPCAIVLDSGRVLVRYKRYPEGVHARNSKHTVIAEGGCANRDPRCDLVSG